MSSLQIGLAIAGGAVLIGVVIHGAWTSRKNKPRQAQPVSAQAQGTDASEVAAMTPLAASMLHADETPSDHLRMDARTDPAVRQEPVLHAYEPVDVGQSHRQEPSLDPVSDLARSLMAQATERAQRVPDEQELARLNESRARQQALDAQAAAEQKAIAQKAHVTASVFVPPENRPSLDALIDVISVIELESPIAGELAVSVMPKTRRVGSKFFTIEGLHANTGLWELPRSGQYYSAFQAGVQLANRVGALNEIEYSEFVLKTQTFADAMGGATEFADMLEQVSRARELDHFATAHDAQLNFNIAAVKSAWSPGYVQQNAARLGFVVGAIPGRLVLPAIQAGQPPILVLEFDSQAALADDPAQTAIQHITLSLDVPQVDPAQEPFARMIQVAHELSRVMDGVVTMDSGEPLTDTLVGAIARDLQSLYATLDARDLSAGSAQARRLFS